MFKNIKSTALLSAIFAIMASPGFAQVTDAINEINEEILNPVTRWVALTLVGLSVLGLLIQGGLMQLNNNMDWQRLAKNASILIVIIVVLSIMTEFLGPRLLDMVDTSTSTSSSSGILDF